ncbi:hypothetical protein B0H11DRAFT_1935477 [Mycena galericulata]|nr:hypothetical protein B0H11DRAFT_1935477 [Mycena galericulata]
MRSSGRAKRCAYSARITVRLRIGGRRSSNKVAMEGAALPQRTGKGGSETRLRGAAEKHASVVDTRPEKGRGAWGVHTRAERGKVGKRVRSWRDGPVPKHRKNGDSSQRRQAHITASSPSLHKLSARLPSIGKIAVGGAILPRIQDVKRGGRSDAFRRRVIASTGERDGVTRKKVAVDGVRAATGLSGRVPHEVIANAPRRATRVAGSSEKNASPPSRKAVSQRIRSSETTVVETEGRCHVNSAGIDGSGAGAASRLIGSDSDVAQEVQREHVKLCHGITRCSAPILGARRRRAEVVPKAELARTFMSELVLAGGAMGAAAKA